MQDVLIFLSVISIKLDRFTGRTMVDNFSHWN